MSQFRRLIPMGCLLMTASLALAQTEAPPAPPQPAAVPAAAARPAAPAPVAIPAPAALPAPAPLPPMDRDLDPSDAIARVLAEQAREMAGMDRDQADQARQLAQQARDMARQQTEDARAQAREMAHQQSEDARAQARTLSEQLRMGISDQVRGQIDEQVQAASQYATNLRLNLAPFAQGVGVGSGKDVFRLTGNDNSLYQRGESAIDSHRWDEALADFSQVASHAGPRADGALFWKAYTLNKLGHRDDALAAIAELRKSYAASRWLDDAKALEIEVKQASGQKVSPEQETDDDLKVLALNGIMQSDPDRAVPLAENLLKGPHSPKLRRNVIFVLAQSSLPRAQQLLEQTARSGNPDLQILAIRDLNQYKRKQGDTGQILSEIYGATSDVNVKRAIIETYRSNKDADHLLAIAKNDKDPNRSYAFQFFAEKTGQPELWQIFPNETSPDVRIELLHCMYQNGNVEKLVEVARTDKDPKVRREAINVLGSQKAANSTEALVTIYSGEQDQQIKQRIIESLSSERNATSLIAMARAEKDPKLKLRIVDSLSRLAPKSKESADYLMEILGK